MRRRSGFTITELLVAMALIVFVMSILATAFSEGMRTFRGLKGLGDMNQRLRTVQTLLVDDLQAKHFEGDRRLSDTNFWPTAGVPGSGHGPPREGFFRVWQGSLLSAANPNYTLEGTDIDYGIPSVRANDHILHFTVKKLGNDPKNFYRSIVPGTSPLLTYGNYTSRYQTNGNTFNTFNSQWAEVAWFLRPLVDVNGQSITANGTPLYTLYRRQRVVVPNPDTGTINPQQTTAALMGLNWPSPVVTAANYNPLPPSALAGQGNYLNVSCRPQSNSNYFFNSPTDLTVPQYRFSMNPSSYGGVPLRPDGRYSIFKAAIVPPTTTPPAGSPPDDANDEPTYQPNQTGSDAVITDVISFVVRVATPTSGGFVDLSSPLLGGSANPLFPSTTNGPFVFDTWTSVVDDTVDYSLWNSPNAPSQVQIPLRANITAIQIQLRVWDNKTEQTRQMTIVVDM
jgi:prepilin-type N-terminal cleavage/methylation domain-containing protein